MLKSFLINFSTIFAEHKTPGIPAPGCDPAVEKYRLEIFLSLLWYLNQADWEKMGAIEKPAPCMDL